MKIGIILWNVRGLEHGDKRRMVRNVCNSHRADVFVLKETKLESV